MEFLETILELTGDGYFSDFLKILKIRLAVFNMFESDILKGKRCSNKEFSYETVLGICFS